MSQTFGGNSMSLTSLIKTPQVKALFKKEFPLKQPKLTGEMKAEPVTKNYPLVGTAFDYLLRFFLERMHPDCVTNPWIAEQSVEHLDGAVKKSNQRTSADLFNAYDKMKSFLRDAKEIHKDYLQTGNLNDNLIGTCITLAQMDAVYRRGEIDPNLGSVDKGDIQDLHNLISLVKPKDFQANKICYLNPEFGCGSALVGGADADLIVDDILIDVKTTKALSFTQEQYNQLIGYYILSKLGKINGTENISISQIGIYFSRHGILYTIPTSKIENNSDFPKFVKSFEKLALAINHPGKN